LAAVLLELAADHEGCKSAWLGCNSPTVRDKLAASFRKTLAAWRRSTKFYGYRESREFGRMLEAWLDQVARELVPRDPPAAVALFESFIEADAHGSMRADDSDGCIGDAVQAACRYWLKAAALCETPASVWPQRFCSIWPRQTTTVPGEELLSRCRALKRVAPASFFRVSPWPPSLLLPGKFRMPQEVRKL